MPPTLPGFALGTRLAASSNVAKKAFSFSPRWSASKRNKERECGTDQYRREGDQRTLYGFRAVYVFDVTQTEGKDLPTLTEVNGDVSGYRERLFKFVEAQSVELSFSEQNCSREGSVAWREDHAAFRDAARRGVFHARA